MDKALRNRTLELFKQLEERPNDVRLRNEIYSLNKGLAISAAIKYSQRCRVPLEDLKQIALMELLLAIPKFDLEFSEKGTSFSSYAFKKCRGALMHYHRDKARIVRPPRSWQEATDLVRSRVRKHNAASSPEYQITEECAARLLYGWDASTWERAIASTKANAVNSIESFDGEYPLACAETPMDRLEDADEKEGRRRAIAALLEALPEQQRCYLVHYYYESLSHRQIAQLYGQREAEVRRQVEQAVNSMRERAGEWTE